MAIKTFTTGEVLTSSDTNTYLNSGGLVYIASGALSSTATNFANCFSATYDNYRIIVDNVNFSASADLYIKFLNGTTPTTGSEYFWAYLGLRADGVANNSQSIAQTQGYIGVTATAGGQVLGSCVMDIYSPFKSSVRSFATVNAVGYQNEWYCRNGETHYNSPNSFDGIRFLTNTAVTVTGTVTIYGYRKP